MKKTYTGVLKDSYFAPKKFINVMGEKIVFIEGISKEIPEEIAFYLLNKNVLAKIQKNKIEHEEFVTTEIHETNFFNVEEEEEISALEEPEESTNLTYEMLTQLYQEHKTWGAVADFLEISTATLKKIRTDLGL